MYVFVTFTVIYVCQQAYVYSENVQMGLKQITEVNQTQAAHKSCQGVVRDRTEANREYLQ